MESRNDITNERQQQARQREFVFRFTLLKLALALFFLLVAVRLVQIQLIDAGQYRAVARKQYEQRFTLPATRGNLYDRHGNVLASNTMLVSFAADPKILGEKSASVSERFARTFGKPKSHYLNKLRSGESSPTKRRFVWLERHVHPELAKQLESTRVDGIVVISEPKRLYHYDDLAGPLLGYTDIDNKGISGLELQLDEELRGVEGSVVMQRDGLGRARPSVDYPQIDPVDGNSVVLTIDLAYQSIVEEELKRGIATNNADAGIAVMLNPKTGEILALACVPGVNPNDYARYGQASAKNRVVTDMFEPGSVFKVVTAAAAYEYGLVEPGQRFSAERGQMRVLLPGGRVRLIRDTHEHDLLTFRESIELSSNIVMAKVSLIIGPERFYRTARDFGFGIPSGVDLPGEVRGRLKKPHEWSGTTLQTLSYGYEVGATPLQMASAYAAVANGGILMKPYVVAEVRDPGGRTLRTQRPQMIRRVISAKTASLLTEGFEGAVERGTAKEVRIQGIRVAGKTGTSRKLVGGKYSTSDYTASFVGYFPVEDPQIVCLVMLDNPRARGYYGGVTSGPVFRAIAERIINTSARFERATTRPPLAQRSGVAVPDVRNLQKSIALKILEGHGLSARLFGDGEVVVRQHPDPGKHLERGDVVQLSLNANSVGSNSGWAIVPDLRGMSIRRAINRLVVDEFDVRVRGSGIVVQQDPAPGTSVRVATVVTLICEPRPMVSAVLY